MACESSPEVKRRMQLMLGRINTPGLRHVPLNLSQEFPIRGALYLAPFDESNPKTGICRVRVEQLNIGLRKVQVILVYSVRGLERSGLGGSHGCPGRLWDRFL